MEPGETRENPDGPQPGTQELEQAIEGVLSRMSPQTAQAVRLAAVPHRFNLDLLAALLGSLKDAGSLLDELRRLGWLGETESGWFIYQDRIRAHQLARLHRQPDGYRQASARAAEFFRSRSTLADNPNPAGDRLEYVYHLLAADEPEGRAELHRLFNGFLGANQPGLAKRLVMYAAEQEALLSQVGRDWLGYLEFQLRRPGSSPEYELPILSKLVAETTDPLLRAFAGRDLGECMVHTRQFKASLAQLHDALRAFQKIGDNLESANTQAMLGRIFVSLAESAGGLRDETPLFENETGKWLYRLQHAPFLMYRWFSRRLDFLPNLYFGMDYQNWVIIRYLFSAIGWFKRAERSLAAGVGQDDSARQAARGLSRTHLHIRLADLYQRVERWSVAERYFAILARDQNVISSPYLQALVNLTCSEALLTRGSLHPGIQALQECQSVFERYGDLNSAGKAARLVAQAQARLGLAGEAIQAYQAAAQAFYKTNDLLNATETSLNAQNLARQFPAGRPGAVPENKFSTAQDQLVFVERFPEGTSKSSLLRLFRGLAIFLALPLTYLLVVLIVLNMTILLGLSEFLFASILNGQNRLALLTDVLMSLPFLLLLPLLILWIYETIYVAAGILIVKVLPLAAFTHPSVYFVIDGQKIASYSPEGFPINSLPWSEVTFAASLDRCAGWAPLSLFSRLLIGNQETTFIVEGILNHYAQFKQQIEKRLRGSLDQARAIPLDFSLLDKRWALATLAITALLVAIFFILKILEKDYCFIRVYPPPGLEARCMYVTALVYQFWKWLIFIGPLFALIHLLQNRWAIRRRLGSRVRTGADWPVWLAFLVVLMMTFLQLVELFS